MSLLRNTKTERYVKYKQFWLLKKEVKNIFWEILLFEGKQVDMKHDF